MQARLRVQCMGSTGDYTDGWNASNMTTGGDGLMVNVMQPKQQLTQAIQRNCTA